MAEQLQNSTESQLCKNCHNFFGSGQTNFLCSKCFRELQLTDRQTHPATQPTQTLPQMVQAEEETKAPTVPDVGRCSKCNRTTGLTDFKCKCGGSFCSRHRLPEDHACVFDHRAIGLRKLSENNPLITAEKVTKI